VEQGVRVKDAKTRATRKLENQMKARSYSEKQNWCTENRYFMKSNHMSLGTNIDKGVSAQKNRTGIGNSDSGPMENIPMVTSS